MIVLIIIYLSSTCVTAEKHPFKCTNNGNYTLNKPITYLNTTITNYTPYSINLHTLFISLYSNISNYGFHSASIGHAPNTVNGFVLCRADVTLQTCRVCVKQALVQVLHECPNARQAAIWYKHCAIRYTNDPLYNMKIADPTFLVRSDRNVSNGKRFREERAALMADLVAQAAKGGSEIKVGVGSRDFSDNEFSKIYGLVQCSPELSLLDCQACLREASKSFQSVAAEGFRVLNPNCNVQYELSVFYNGTRLAELGVPVIGSLPSSPARQPGNSFCRTKVRKIIFIVLRGERIK